MPDLTDEIMARIEAGASGYVLKGASSDYFVGSIRSVDRGESFCSPRMAASNRALQEIVNTGLPGMMAHLMAHGQGGGSQGKQVTMADCPMMMSINGGVTHPTEQFKFSKAGLMDRR